LNRNHQHEQTPEKTFAAKITAGLSHEFMNVLAIIRERSGLMEDLLALDKHPFPYREKFVKSLASVRAQVNRGMEIGEDLNRFAHSMDQPRTRLEINEALRQFASLMQRFVRLRKAQLTVEPDDAPLEIETDVFRLQMIFAACVEYCLLCSAIGGTITLHAYRTDKGIAIRFLGPPDSSRPTVDGGPLEEQDDLTEALRSIGAALSPLSTANRTGLELILPD
jgi:signal transduction histidine kinase